MCRRTLEAIHPSLWQSKSQSKNGIRKTKSSEMAKMPEEKKLPRLLSFPKLACLTYPSSQRTNTKHLKDKEVPFFLQLNKGFPDSAYAIQGIISTLKQCNSGERQMVTIHLTELDHGKTIFFALVLPKVSYSLLELLLIIKSSSRKEKQPKSTPSTFSKAKTDFQKGFYTELLFAHH